MPRAARSRTVSNCFSINSPKPPTSTHCARAPATGKCPQRSTALSRAVKLPQTNSGGGRKRSSRAGQRAGSPQNATGDRLSGIQTLLIATNEVEPAPPLRARRSYWRNMARTRQSAVANRRALEPPRWQVCSLDRQSEPDVALALDLVHQIDFPAQIALARALTGIGVVGPPPAIVGRVGHGLAPGSERQIGGSPNGGAAFQHPDFLKAGLPKFGAGEPRQNPVGRGKDEHPPLRHPLQVLRQAGTHGEPRAGNM